MKKYESPKLKLIAIDVEDIITESTGEGGPGDGDNDMGWMSLDRPVNVTDK